MTARGALDYWRSAARASGQSSPRSDRLSSQRSCPLINLDSGSDIAVLKVDGGACENDFDAVSADVLGIPTNVQLF